MAPARTFTHHKTGAPAAMQTENIGRGRPARDTRENGHFPVVPAAPPPPPRPESEMPKSRGVALAYSAKAIEYLGMIPPNDGLREEALSEVAAWIEHNR
jgi:hypothetical protein